MFSIAGLEPDAHYLSPILFHLFNNPKRIITSSTTLNEKQNLK